jgi:DNA repair exonuclease SbcCD ATPase subunit
MALDNDLLTKWIARPGARDLIDEIQAERDAHAATQHAAEQENEKVTAAEDERDKATEALEAIREAMRESMEAAGLEYSRLLAILEPEAPDLARLKRVHASVLRVASGEPGARRDLQRMGIVP